VVNTADSSSDVYPVVSNHTVTSGDAAVVKGVVFAHILSPGGVGTAAYFFAAAGAALAAAFGSGSGRS
jgi:hypothetical protein